MENNANMFNDDLIKEIKNGKLFHNFGISSPKIISKIKKILPPAKEFYKLRREEQRKINARLQEIFGMKKTFKTLASLERRGDYMGIEVQKIEYELFYRGFNTLMVSETPEKSKGKSLIYYFTETVDIIKEKLRKFDKTLEFKEENTVIAQSISSKSLFACFLSSIVCEAYENFLTADDKEDQVHERGLSLKKISVLYEIRHEILCHILNAVLRYTYTTRKNCELTEKKLNNLFQIMLKDNNNINLICVRKNVAIITEILFNLLENNNFLSDNELVYDHKKRKDYKIYKLNSSLDPIFSLSIQVPDLVKPRKLKKKDVIVKDIFSGANEFKPSKRFMEAVDIANQTPYVVDVEALKLFKEQRDLKFHKSYNLPFPTFYEEKEAREEAIKRYHVMKASNRDPTFLNHYSIDQYSVAIKKVQVNRRKLLVLNSMITFAEFLEEYTFFYSKKFDYRGRQYPQARFAANTLGDFRYLVKIKDCYSINEVGLKEVFKAIYSNTLHKEAAAKYLSNELGCYKDKKTLYRKLLEFVLKNKLNWQCLKKNYLYKILLIQKFKVLADNNFKTSIYVERDQKTSSSVFMSILLRNRELASKSNLMGISDDIIKILQKYFLDYVKDRIVNGETILSHFKEDRNLLKKGFMFLSYGQKKRSRLEDFKTYLKKKRGVSISDADFQVLKKISSEFESFLDIYLGDYCFQLEKLDKIFAFVIKANNKYSTVTLDGVHLSWVTYKQPSTKSMGYYDPISKSRKFFRKSYTEEFIKINLRKTLLSCRANLIHSFDGAIIREFSRRFKEKGYNILTIHDCIQYNPNAAKLFEQIVKDIYVHNNIIKDFYNSAFMHPRKSLEEDLLKDFDKLVAELYANSKLTRISDSLDYESLYELE